MPDHASRSARRRRSASNKAGAWLVRVSFDPAWRGSLYSESASGSSSVVECFLAKEDVAGSTPVSRSNLLICTNTSSSVRRGTQVVRERSAKPLCVGSIPTRASNLSVAEALHSGGLLSFLASSLAGLGSGPLAVEVACVLIAVVERTEPAHVGCGPCRRDDASRNEDPAVAGVCMRDPGK